MPQINACPDAALLKKAIVDQLAAGDGDVLLQHVEACEHCVATLARATHDDTLVNLLRAKAARFEDYEPEAVNRLLARISALGLKHADVKVTADMLPAIAATPPPTPERIGRYRVERVIGKGGFGTVYLAHDDQLMRRVAIKTPHAHIVAHAGSADAYLNEARTAVKLEHPNIVPVHDVGSTDEFPCFVVSKYIDGADLAARVKDSRLSTKEAVELVATVADALHHAHKHGCVHRDIKPGNILLDQNDKPFVGDFGLALSEQDVGKGPRFAGTPAYMSPEQARGDGHRVDGRSDIFSLGVVLYELLTGRRPFCADSRDDLLAQIISMDVRPPRQWTDAIPGELERICLQALAKQPAERYTTAKDVAADLRQLLRVTVRGAPQPEPLVSASLAGRGNLSTQMGLHGPRGKVVRCTFLFTDFKGFTERVRILEKTAGHEAAVQMKRRITDYMDETLRKADIETSDFQLIDTAGDGFFFHFRRAGDVFRFVKILHAITAEHNAGVSDAIAQHWFHAAAVTGDVAWDEGKPIGHVVNTGARLQAASKGGDLVIDQATFDALGPEMRRQFGAKSSVRDKHGKTYEAYHSAFSSRASAADSSKAAKLAFPPNRQTSRQHCKASRTIVLVAAAALLIAAGVVFCLPTSSGTIRVEINDAKIAAAVTKHGITFRGTGAKDFLVRPGQHSLQIVCAGVTFHTKTFELRNAETVRVSISLLDDKLLVLKEGRPFDGAAVAGADPSSTIRVAVNDSRITAAVDTDGAPIRGNNANDIRVKPGQHSLRVSCESLSFRTKTFDSCNGETVRLAIVVSNGKIQVLKNDSLFDEMLLPTAVVATPTKFTPLFNGKDLVGWRPNAKEPGNWRVVEGILIGSGPVGTAGNYLCTHRGDFTDFHLRAELRINDRANSGILLRSPFDRPVPPVGKAWQSYGYEAQINSKDVLKTGSLLMRRPLGRRETLVNVSKALTTSREWFTLEIHARGTRIVVKINGATTAEWTDEQHNFKTGHIVLQQLTADTIVEFRKIEISEG